MPRHPDPQLEQRILNAASRLWGRGGPKALTMRAVAKAASTTTPTVYERYHDRADILRALRLQTRNQLYATLSRARNLREACRRHIQFALKHPHAYEVLFDGVAKPPSLYEPWPSFNLLRQRLTERLGGTLENHNRLILALWSLMHGCVMLIIRGGFEGSLRTQAVHACMDAFEGLVACVERHNFAQSGPPWPSTLVLGEAGKSKVNHDHKSRKRREKRGVRSAKKKRRR